MGEASPSSVGCARRSRRREQRAQSHRDKKENVPFWEQQTVPISWSTGFMWTKCEQCVCACVRAYVCTCVPSSLCYLGLSFLVISLLSPSFISATQTNFSHLPALIGDNSLSFFAIVLSCSIRLHEDFKLAKTFACWANSAATMCYRTTVPLEAFLILMIAQKKIRNGQWPLLNHSMPSPFYTTERAKEENHLPSCCLSRCPVVPVPGSWWEVMGFLACDCRNKNSKKGK